MARPGNDDGRSGLTWGSLPTLHHRTRVGLDRVWETVRQPVGSEAIQCVVVKT